MECDQGDKNKNKIEAVQEIRINKNTFIGMDIFAEHQKEITKGNPNRMERS